MTTPPSTRVAPEGSGQVSDKGRVREALERFPRSFFSPIQALPAEDLMVEMLGPLNLVGTERVLELGSTTGYAASVLSVLAKEVYSVASTPELARQQEEDMQALGCHNVHVVRADGQAGWPTAAPYQAILVMAGVTEIPIELIHQLDLGGRLVVPVGDAHAQLLELLCKRTGALDSQTLGSCHLHMLAGSGRSCSCLPWTRT